MRLGIALAALAPLTSSAPDELVSDSTRSRIVMAADDIAKLGEPALVDEMAAILADAGEPAEDIEDRRSRWDRNVERAKLPVSDGTRRGVVRRLEAAVKAIEKEAQSIEDASVLDVAELILRLDSQSEAANELLGREKVRGRYVSPDEAELDARAREINAAVDEAMHVDVEVEHVSPSPSKFVQDMYGEDSHAVRAQGIVVHGGISPDRLERALRQALRALSFTVWLKTGEVEVPSFNPEIEIFFTNDYTGYSDALDLAESSNRIDADMLRLARGGTGGFPTKGDVYVARWCPESQVQSGIIWFARKRVLPPKIEPYLLAGHVNWLCLRFVGTSKPGVAWVEQRPSSERTTTAPGGDTDALWRAASSGLFGARSFLVRMIDAGDSVTLADSILDQEGLVTGIELLVATVVCDYMQLKGTFWDIASSERGADEPRIRATERALDAPIPAYDAEWQGWLKGEGGGAGLLQRIAGSDEEDSSARDDDPVGEEAHEYLKEIRKAAFEPLRVWTETLGHYPELSENAAKHAAYLQLNPDQKSAWPDAHEEYADKEGFSAEGAWAGGHSVIAFDGDVTESIDAWMATFYHRLPLLEPGLCGVGAAVDGEVVVMDTGSLLNEYQGPAHVKWPHDGQRKVPLRWRPESPNPVPGEDQSGWGYPVTVQSYWGPKAQDASVVLTLYIDGDEEPVDCHFISPTTAKFDRLIPANAYCLIPKERLESSTTYRVVAEVPELAETWEWTFETGSKTY